jgi:catechol-2,3-dioxygenase
MGPVTRLNHAVLFVADVERSIEFYRAALGFEVIARPPGMNAAFLRAAGSSNHHDLGLFGIGSVADAGARRPDRRPGLYHLAWQVATIDDLVATRSRLSDLGALSGQSDHGATKSLYAHDPDGLEFEVMWMLPRESWGAHEHDAVVQHLDLAHEVARWSGVTTA